VAGAALDADPLVGTGVKVSDGGGVPHAARLTAMPASATRRPGRRTAIAVLMGR
jgi:hypothetical protein